MPSASSRHRSLRSLVGILVTATVVASALLVPASAANAWVPGAGQITGSIPQAAGHAGWVTVYDRLGDYVESGALQADGSFAIPGLGTGDYSVLFAVEGFRHEWWQDTFEQFEATAVPVVDGETTVIDPTLDPVGSISGTIMSEAGEPFESAGVSAYKNLDGIWEPVEYAYTTDGTFQLWLPTGEYKLRFFAEDAVHEFYDNVSSVGDARLFSVDPTTNFSGIDARLALGARLTGEIAVPQEGYHEVQVAAYDAATGDHVREIHAWDEDGDGDLDWTLDSLPSAALRIEYARSGPYGVYAGAYHHDVPETLGAAAATLVTLAPGEVRTGLHQTLVLGGQLTGRLVGVDGSPQAWCNLQLTDPAGVRTTRSAWTSEDGTFTVQGLSTGDYAVAVTGGETCDHVEHYTSTDGRLTRASGDLAVHVTEGEASTLPTDLVYGASPAVTNETLPTISGEAKLGRLLTSTQGTWSPDDVTLTLQWYRGTTAIPGATGRSYRVLPADLGQRIHVTVTAEKPGYTSATASSAATAEVVRAAAP